MTKWRCSKGRSKKTFPCTKEASFVWAWDSTSCLKKLVFIVDKNLTWSNCRKDSFGELLKTTWKKQQKHHVSNSFLFVVLWWTMLTDALQVEFNLLLLVFRQAFLFEKFCSNKADMLPWFAMHTIYIHIYIYYIYYNWIARNFQSWGHDKASHCSKNSEE